MQTVFENGVLTLTLTGNVTGANAPELEAEIYKVLEQLHPDAVVIDCDGVEYMSSSGLHVILRVRQNVDQTSLIRVHPEFYEILETTGFTEMMEVQKAHRVVSVAGCELIGRGANGKIYRLDEENIIKVYTNTDSLPEIRHERELSRAAFVLGVPTAIPYDVVMIAEGGYGSIYELLNAKTYVQLYNDGEKTLKELAEMSVALLKLIHSRVVIQSFVPSARDTTLGWFQILRDDLPSEEVEKLCTLISALPDDMHMIHGDYHFRNLMYQNGESLLIDMDKLSHGHPVFELAAIYNAYCGFGAVDHSVTKQFMGIDYETTVVLWRKILEGYLETKEESTLQSIEDKVKVISYARLMRHMIRENEINTEAGRKQFAYYHAGLTELLPRIDTLQF